VLYASYPGSAPALRAYTRLLARTGVELAAAPRLPECRERTGVSGPLPPAGRVACVDSGDATAVIWVDEPAGVVGVARIDDDARGAWRDYGPSWPRFVRSGSPAPTTP
jgi:hypothetical protein